MINLTDEELFDELQRRFAENKKTLQDFIDLTEQLKVVNKKLEESEELKSHFLSNIRNQIINPFASILGLSKSILALKQKDWKRAYSMAKMIYSEAFSLDFQLNNIFEAAKMEAGEAHPEVMQVEVNEITKNVIDSFEHQFEQKEIKVLYTNTVCTKENDLFYFKTDPVKYQLIISNLLNNAIEYSGATTKIEVKIWIKDAQLHVSVADHGIGIDEKDQKVIFDRFKRLDTSINSVNQGHGLGLSVVKSLVETLEGEITVSSQKNYGSVFTIILPEGEINTGMGSYATDTDEFLFESFEEDTETENF